MVRAPLIESKSQQIEPPKPQVSGESVEIKEQPKVIEEEPKPTDVELKLHRILKGTPLESQIAIIIREADKNGFNPAFTAAISIIESSGGVHNFRPYNAWGWYGGKGFASWEQSITAWSEYFNRVYISKGLTTPKTIQPKYCPPNPSWATKVQSLMNK